MRLVGRAEEDVGGLEELGAERVAERGLARDEAHVGLGSHVPK